MPYAHKLSTYQDDAHKPVTYCTVCGHEKDLSGECPGEYQLSAKEQVHIDDCFNADMAKIFGSFPGSNVDFYKKQRAKG